MGEEYTLNGLSHGDCGSVSLKMSAEDVTEVLGKPRTPGNKDKRRKLQIKYRAVRAFKKNS